MKKTLLILSLILVSVVSFAQRQRTTAMFDSDTTTRPKAGFYGIGVRANNVYFVPPTGNNIRLANYSLFTGLGINYLTKWNGSKFVNSVVFDNGTNVGIGTTSPGAKLHVIGNYRTSKGNGIHWVDLNDEIRVDDTPSWFSSHDNVMTFKAYAGAWTFYDTDGLRNVMSILGSGNVGIGTTSPISKVHINGSQSGIGSDGIIIANNDIAFGNTHNSRFLTQSYGNGKARTLFYAASNTTGTTQGQFDVLTENGGNYLISVGSDATTKNSMGLYNLSGTEIVRINTDGDTFINGGNVGIGTTTPTSKLQVVGLPVYADNTAATSGGLTAGAFYRTSTGVLMVVY